MNILGMGIVFARGSGLDSFETALKQGWYSPAEVHYGKDRKGLAYLVNPGMPLDRALMKKMRRSDKFSKMAVCAASEALNSSGIEDIDRKNIGIITATAYGAHVTTFNFLNDILEYGDANVSPTVFSNSVHNAAASYVSSALGIQGPTLTVTQFFFSFHGALQVAYSWLNESRCDSVLVGAVEQYGDVLGYIYDTKLKTAPDGMIRPFNLNPTFAVPGEGAVFFLVSNREPDNVYCKIENIFPDNDTEDMQPVDLNIIDTDGLLTDETVYQSSLSGDIPAAAYSPLFGSMMTGSAFNCAAGALMIKNRIQYANPVTDNPHGLNLLSEQKSANIELIRCIRYNCFGNKASIYLRKK